jgi:hypothetical protein
LGVDAIAAAAVTGAVASAAVAATLLDLGPGEKAAAVVAAAASQDLIF